jgi:hypothetical protein
VPFTIDIVGDANDVRLDGEALDAGRHETAAGLHQLVARGAGEVVFAQWIGIASGSALHVVLPTPEPCSLADVTSAAAPTHVLCPSWISVRRGATADTFVVQSCAASTCGSELVIRRFPGSTPDDHHIGHRGLPTWAVWTLVATGIVVAGAAAGLIGWLAVPPVQQTVWKTTTPQ